MSFVFQDICWPNIMKMLHYRGYNTEKFDKFQPSLFVHAVPSMHLPSLLLFCATSEKTDINHIKSMVTSAKQHPKLPKHVIFVFDKSITPGARKLAEASSQIKFEIYCHRRFYQCLVEHDLVPKHKIVKKAESKNYLKEFNLKPENLPRQPIDDEISKFYGLKTGDLIVFNREYPSMEPQLFIRIVC